LDSRNIAERINNEKIKVPEALLSHLIVIASRDSGVAIFCILRIR
jgi:hypothetical protein